MEQGGAYGAGKSGEAFNLVDFLKRPKTVLRLLSWIFSLIQFACIVSEGYDKREDCIFGKDSNACHFGVAVGVLAFILAIVFFIFDLIFPSISSASKRKKIVMADLAFSGLWTFLFFVAFCYLTNTWTNRRMIDQTDYYFGADNARAAITFSFFSIGTWGGLTYYAVQAYRQGTLSAFAPSYQDPMYSESSAPYKSFPGAAELTSPPYQQGPFTDEGAAPTYQPPTY